MISIPPKYAVSQDWDTNSRADARLRIRFLQPLLCCRRIDHGPDFRDAVGWEAALPRMFAHRRLIRRNVDTVNLVSRDVAVQPLNLRTEIPQDAARLLRNRLQLLRLQIPGSGNFALNDKFGHAGPPLDEMRNFNI